MEMFGYTREEILRLNGRDLSIDRHPYTLKEALKWIRKARAGPPQLQEWLCKDKRGRPFWVEANFKLILLNNEKRLLGIIRDISQRKEMEAGRARYQDDLRSLVLEFSQVEERERHRLATAIHDDISQTLAMAKIKLEILRVKGTVSGRSRILRDIIKLLEQSIYYTRTLSFELSNPILYELGFKPAIEWLAELFQKRYHLKIEVKGDDQEQPVPLPLRILLFQSVRELLTNTVKHAQARKAAVAIFRDRRQIKVEVTDDGIGFTPNSNEKRRKSMTGFGLFSIRERLRQVGGSLAIAPGKARGTKIILRIPIDKMKHFHEIENPLSGQPSNCP